MPIIVSEPVASRGKSDAKRHRDKQREIIKKHLPDIIAEEAIIKGDSKGKVVKIPIRSIDLPHFRPTKNQGGSGIGQGEGKPGDIIGSRPGDDQGSGDEKAGNRPGIDYIETEVLMEEIIEMMMDDLGLPNLDDKNIQQVAVSVGFKIRGITRAGAPQLLSRTATVREGIKRFYGALSSVEKQTGADQLTCYRALRQTDGMQMEAVELIKSGAPITVLADEVVPFPIIFNEDLRYHKQEEKIEFKSNAVVIAMMDVSGSMGTMKKYLARSALFWLVNFLRHFYDNVEVRFVVHHTEARIVEEQEFFKTGESGGTVCSSAYSIANSLIENEYPTDSWNDFVVHFSDGDNYYSDNDDTVAEVKKLLAKNVSMVGYAEVDGDGGSGSKSDSALWSVFKDKLKLSVDKENGVNIIVGDINMPFLGVAIKEKKDLLPALKVLLQKSRWQA